MRADGWVVVGIRSTKQWVQFKHYQLQKISCDLGGIHPSPPLLYGHAHQSWPPLTGTHRKQFTYRDIFLAMLLLLLTGKWMDIHESNIFLEVANSLQRDVCFPCNSSKSPKSCQWQAPVARIDRWQARFS